MARIRVSIDIDAPPAQVWAAIRDVRGHAAWMADARAIRVTSRRSEGVGTTYECDTRIGPLRLIDHMVVTEWRPGRAMGVSHTGVVTGTGRFTLRPVRRSGRTCTRFRWQERLVFPWWLGGPVGALVGGRVLRWVWRRNLTALKAMVESRAEPVVVSVP